MRRTKDRNTAESPCAIKGGRGSREKSKDSHEGFCYFALRTTSLGTVADSPMWKRPTPQRTE